MDGLFGLRKGSLLPFCVPKAMLLPSKRAAFSMLKHSYDKLKVALLGVKSSAVGRSKSVNG